MNDVHVHECMYMSVIWCCCRNRGQCNEKGITECDTLAYGNGEGRFCCSHVVINTSNHCNFPRKRVHVHEFNCATRRVTVQHTYTILIHLRIYRTFVHRLLCKCSRLPHPFQTLAYPVHSYIPAPKLGRCWMVLVFICPCSLIPTG